MADAPRRATWWAAHALVLLVAAQFYSAGVGLFGASGFAAHRALGALSIPLCIVLVVAALRSGRGRRSAGLAAGCLLLVIAQPLLIVLARPGWPAIAALHPVLGLALGVMTWALASRERAAEVDATRVPEAGVMGNRPPVRT